MKNRREFVLLKGRELMVERIKMRIKGQDLAKMIGITQSYVSKMENERQEIPIHIYKKWISTLKINN
jgi:transcriptional regulator with XRE-family HTH domain